MQSKISDALTEAQDWLNSNDDAEKDDFEEHQKELQLVCDLIIGKVYKNKITAARDRVVVAMTTKSSKISEQSVFICK